MFTLNKKIIYYLFIQTSEETKFLNIPLDRIYPNKRGNKIFEHPIGSYLSKQARKRCFRASHWIVICQMGMLENFVSSLVWVDI